MDPLAISIMKLLDFIMLIPGKNKGKSYLAPRQGNVKVGTKLLILIDSDNLKIRNPNIEIRNNIKIQISNDKNIPDTYTTSIGSSKSFEFGISVIRICFGFRISSFEFTNFF